MSSSQDILPKVGLFGVKRRKETDSYDKGKRRERRKEKTGGHSR